MVMFVTGPGDLRRYVATRPANIVTLVHGTFAQRARWIMPHSLVRDMLALRVPGIDFREFHWSGSIRHVERQRAALELEKQLRQQVLDYPDARHFVIAHSHGGNISLYALRDPELQAKVRRIICLNTPFIFPLRRSISTVIRGPLTLVLAVAPFIAFPFFRFVVDSDSGRAASLPFLLLGTAGALILFFGVLWTTEKFRWRERVEQAREAALSRLTLPRQNNTTVTCLWSASDEVYEIVYALSDMLANFPYMLLRPLSILVIFVVALLASLTGFLDLFSVSDMLPAVGILIRDAQEEAVKQQNVVLGLQFRIVASFFSSVVFILALVVALELLAVFLNALARFLPLGISAVSSLEAHYIRVIVTLTPVSGERIEFEDFDSPGGIIKHCAIYNDQRVIARLAELLRQNDD
jgi:hypothetical protein